MDTKYFEAALAEYRERSGDLTPVDAMTLKQLSPIMARADQLKMQHAQSLTKEVDNG